MGLWGVKGVEISGFDKFERKRRNNWCLRKEKSKGRQNITSMGGLCCRMIGLAFGVVHEPKLMEEA